MREDGLDEVQEEAQSCSARGYSLGGRPRGMEDRGIQIGLTPRGEVEVNFGGLIVFFLVFAVAYFLFFDPSFLQGIGDILFK